MEGDPLGPECPPVTSQSGHCPGPGKVAHRAGQPWRDGLVSCTLVSMAAAISSCRATGLPLLPCRAAVASAPAAPSPGQETAAAHGHGRRPAHPLGPAAGPSRLFGGLLRPLSGRARGALQHYLLGRAAGGAGHAAAPRAVLSLPRLRHVRPRPEHRSCLRIRVGGEPRPHRRGRTRGRGSTRGWRCARPHGRARGREHPWDQALEGRHRCCLHWRLGGRARRAGLDSPESRSSGAGVCEGPGPGRGQDIS